MKITLVAGLPGSGKTYLLRALAEQGAMCIDDPRALSELPADPIDWLAIADPNFCRASNREAAEKTLTTRYGSPVFEWLFFENDPETCSGNAIRRDDGRDVQPDILALSRTYRIPADAVVLPVYSGPTNDAEMSSLSP